MDNDAIHKFAYRHREMAADLLRLAVPELAPLNSTSPRRRRSPPRTSATAPAPSNSATAT